MKLIEWQGTLDGHNQEVQEYIEYYKKYFSMHGFYFTPDFAMPPLGPIMEDRLTEYTIHEVFTVTRQRWFRLEHHPDYFPWNHLGETQEQYNERLKRLLNRK